MDHLEIVELLIKYIDSNIQKDVFLECCNSGNKEIIKWFLFKRGFLNNHDLVEHPLCVEIIKEEENDIFRMRKMSLLIGYIQNGYKSLFSDKVSLCNFKECLLMV